MIRKKWLLPHKKYIIDPLISFLIPGQWQPQSPSAIVVPDNNVSFSANILNQTMDRPLHWRHVNTCCVIWAPKQTKSSRIIAGASHITENIKARVNGPPRVGSNGDRWIPSQRASNTENMFMHDVIIIFTIYSLQNNLSWNDCSCYFTRKCKHFGETVG